MSLNGLHDHFCNKLFLCVSLHYRELTVIPATVMLADPFQKAVSARPEGSSGLPGDAVNVVIDNSKSNIYTPSNGYRTLHRKLKQKHNVVMSVSSQQGRLKGL